MTIAARDLASFHLLGDERPGGLELADGGRQVHQELGHRLVMYSAGVRHALGGVASVEQAGPGVVEQRSEPVGRQAVQERTDRDQESPDAGRAE